MRLAARVRGLAGHLPAGRALRPALIAPLAADGGARQRSAARSCRCTLSSSSCCGCCCGGGGGGCPPRRGGDWARRALFAGGWPSVSSARAYTTATPPTRAAAAPPPNTDPSTTSSSSPGWLSPAAITVAEPERFNRWGLIPFSMANHMCLGSVYAWSVFNTPLAQLHGVVAPAPMDWSLPETSLTFSLIMGGFVWSAVLAPLHDRWGPRACGLLGAASLGLGFTLGGAAIALHNLPLLYTAGAVWGMANGWVYVPPVSALISWFPDRKGLASGAVVAGFAGGAILTAPLAGKLLETFRVPPEYLGAADEVAVVARDGKLWAEGVGDSLAAAREVVIATAADVASWGLSEGVYAVGTGSAGVAETFVALGAGFASVMAVCAMAYRLPRAGFVPASVAKAHASTAEKDGTGPAPSPSTITTHNVAVPAATRTPQFLLAWLGSGLAFAPAYSLLSVSKTMLCDSFGVLQPGMVDAAFASAFIAGISLGNLGGRLGWSTLSDALGHRLGDAFRGRKRTFMAICGLSIPLYLGALGSIHQGIACGGESLWPLVSFTACMVGMLSCYGGVVALVPPFMGDLFGTKNLGTLASRQLSVILISSFSGPLIATFLRESSMRQSMLDLAAKVDDMAFSHAFGGGKERLAELIDSKAVTINRLLELAPVGTADPTPLAYDQTLLILCGFQAAALLAFAAIKPVPHHLHDK